MEQETVMKLCNVFMSHLLKGRGQKSIRKKFVGNLSMGTLFNLGNHLRSDSLGKVVKPPRGGRIIIGEKEAIFIYLFGSPRFMLIQ